jgi:hypothetical protein
MRLLISCASLSLLLGTPAFASADSFNAFSQPDIRTGDSNLSWSYNWRSANSAESVLAQLRKVCSSDDRFDRRRCAKGTEILRNAYAELQARRAAEDAIAE